MIFEVPAISFRWVSGENSRTFQANGSACSTFQVMCFKLLLRGIHFGGMKLDAKVYGNFEGDLKCIQVCEIS